MAAGNVTTTTIDAFIPENWSDLIILETVERAVVMNLVNRKWEADLTKGDKVHVSIFSAFAAVDKVDNTALTYQTATESVVDIEITDYKAVPFLVEKKAITQSGQDLIGKYTIQAGKQLSKSIDVNCSNQFVSVDTTQNVGTTTTAGVYEDISDITIRNAIQLLDEAEAPEEDRYLVISPAQKNAMLGIAKFVEADKIASNAVITTGIFGQIYGVWVYVSNNLPDVVAIASAASSASGSAVAPVGAYKACGMFQKDGISLAIQSAIEVNTAWENAHIGWSIVANTLYGSKVTRAEFVVQVRTTTEV